jgi:hypothetical protein
MQYMLMICDDESVILSPAQVHALPQIQAWDAEVDGRGIRRGGARLRPSIDATTVRVRDGEVLVSDGPSPKPRNKSAASTSSNARASMRLLRSPPDIQPPPAA